MSRRTRISVKVTRTPPMELFTLVINAKFITAFVTKDIRRRRRDVRRSRHMRCCIRSMRDRQTGIVSSEIHSFVILIGAAQTFAIIMVPVQRRQTTCFVISLC